MGYFPSPSTGISRTGEQLPTLQLLPGANTAPNMSARRTLAKPSPSSPSHWSLTSWGASGNSSSMACKSRRTRVKNCSDTFSFAQWDVDGLAALLSLSFNPDGGTRQGHILSPFNWLEVFDDPALQFQLRRSPGTILYSPRFICCAGDLQSFAAPGLGLNDAPLCNEQLRAFN